MSERIRLSDDEINFLHGFFEGALERGEFEDSRSLVRGLAKKFARADGGTPQEYIDEEVEESNSIMEKLLRKYCESYVANLYCQCLGVNISSLRYEADDSDIIKNTTDNLDMVRVKIHKVIAEFFDIDTFNDDDEDSKTLNNILNALGANIGMPLPSKAAFMPAKQSPHEISERKLKENFDDFVEKYGKKLADRLIEEFVEGDSDA